MLFYYLQAVLRDQETADAILEAEVRNLELQLQKKIFEQVGERIRPKEAGKDHY